MELAAGMVIAGKYRLERLLGRGGMGSVWTAHHGGLDTLVAIKFIDAELVDSPESRGRFEREARTAARLRSAHVVQILDHGIDTAATGRDLPFIVMELLHGEDLSQRIERTGPLSLAALVPIVGQVARALQKAHEAGIVHRDLKPENVFLVREDDAEIAKVLDFGIAKDQRARTLSPNDSGTLGTAPFMSPEQARGDAGLDARADVWGLAVIVFEALTGALPFQAPTLGELLIAICTAPAPSARAIAPGLPPSIDAFFQRALAKDPAQRFQSARDLAAALADVARDAAPALSASPARGRWPLAAAGLLAVSALSAFVVWQLVRPARAGGAPSATPVALAPSDTAPVASVATTSVAPLGASAPAPSAPTVVPGGSASAAASNAAATSPRPVTAPRPTAKPAPTPSASARKPIF